MKKPFMLICLALVGKASLACSCWPYEPDFFKNVSATTYNCIAVFDTMDYSYSYQGIPGETGYFLLIDTINSIGSAIGTTIIVTGQDGLNCGETLTSFQRGDTVVLALFRGFYMPFERDTFYLEGYCGLHYLLIWNGQSGGLTLQEIKDKIARIISPSAVGWAESALRFDVFPNPASHQVFIGSPSEQIRHIRLVDSMSRPVLFRQEELLDYIVLDLSGLVRGCYHLTVTTERGQSSRTLLKM